jgi:hypothetical protein
MRVEFFATSHSKDACDGIVGVVKRTVARASLQRLYKDQILTPESFFSYCKENITGINCLYTFKEEVLKINEKLKDRFAKSVTLKDTHGFHKIVPINTETLEAFQISQSTSSTNAKISEVRKSEDVSCVKGKDSIGHYVSCNFEGNMWIGIVENFSDEFEDFL